MITTVFIIPKYQYTLFSFCLHAFRQPTPFDRLCYQVVAADQGPIGARVFYDCDILMKEIMKHLLLEDELEEWEGAAEERLEQYAKQRCCPDEIN